MANKRGSNCSGDRKRKKDLRNNKVMEALGDGISERWNLMDAVRRCGGGCSKHQGRYICTRGPQESRGGPRGEAAEASVSRPLPVCVMLALSSKQRTIYFLRSSGSRSCQGEMSEV
ncbi:Hypothetical predicted protein [Xyrichtys novacula]|uniref:Uncharacterized protein n=1 Tax=Xyrichtys novacula TaxID=13765 RepID=A0AAV1GW81_XYRNO|nr:Hypothetical predicted protein [Xyrichtys novacula]